MVTRLLLGLCLVTAAACSDDGGSEPRICPTPEPFPMVTADAGTLTALKAQRCNVSGSMGARKWYRLSATLPGSTDIVQLELYDGVGAFAGGVVRVGSFPVDTGDAQCGVCLRALGNKGEASETEYVGTAGTVNITALGADAQPISATITGASFSELGVAATGLNVPCTATLAAVKIDGTVMDLGG
ncbi:MAG: hypothetical protein H0T42_29755, partial [Deltaproteobacteria bacterium]|nr:hypothetical protein [Deltaproteobacteria bacterium]